MQELARHLVQALQRGPVVLATVLWTQGSAPREVGAKLLIESSGQLQGTIGGGAGEHKVCQVAAQVMDSGQPCQVQIDLTGAIGPGLAKEGICGGRMGVWLCRWQGPQAQELATQIQACCVPDLEHSPDPEEQILVLPLSDQPPYLRLASAEDPQIQVSETDYQERLVPPPLLVIVGAGHVGTALAEMASMAGFQVLVCDDRQEWASSERFTTAQAGGSLADQLPLLGTLRNRSLYVALVTRGYGQDLEALTQILPLTPHYLGMIGSRRRVSAVVQSLRSQGHDQILQQLQEIPFYAPIGLDIGALTPAEIAISIVAELILHRRGGQGGPLRRSIGVE